MKIDNLMKKTMFLNKLNVIRNLYAHYKNEYPGVSKVQFTLKEYRKIGIIKNTSGKADQIANVIHKCRINSLLDRSFIYSIDPELIVERTNTILDNYSIDYSWVVYSCFNDIQSMAGNTVQKLGLSQIIRELEQYVSRMRKEKGLIDHNKSIEEIESVFYRPAEHFHEAIQRILFVNQWLWQTGHKHNGFGHLDWILYDLYQKDTETGFMTKEETKQYLKEFFFILHDKCWYKSTLLLGDTGQIIILGGLSEDDKYRCNDLTYLFIDVSRELKLPDPKVLLRVSKNIPDELLVKAVKCISTGIGAPFLSNDDMVIPALIQYGYDKSDAYNYATSACWEPLILGKSCDQNNIQTINFCKPFVDFIDSEEFEKCKDIEDVKRGYHTYLAEYINQFLTCLDEKEFEEDPLLTLFSPVVLKTGKDIVRGGAKYENLGVTSVGLSTVVNSLLNLDQFVFQGKQYTLHDLNDIRKKDFNGNEELRRVLDKGAGAFGEDDNKIVDLTNELLQFISAEFHKHHTKHGGNYKFGLSSPNYIVDARNIGATFDGRKAGTPFGTHISGKNGLAPTELISFASQLDYNDNRINGNVVDFIVSPEFLKSNMSKALTMIKAGIKQGFYQLQINVIDSKTLIEAQQHPEKFPNLVVRVWGFSAYFKDLPKDYQDNLIRRAIEAEMAA